MIYKITITNDYNESIVMDLFDPYSSGLAIQSIDGLGPVDSNITITDYASKPGALFNGSRQSTRNIVINLVFLDSLETIEQVRHKTYRYFPNGRKVKVSVQTDTRTLETDGYIEKNEPSIWAEDHEGCQISIICESPFFKSPTQTVSKLSQITDSFHFPFTSTEEPELHFGYLNIDRSVTVHNEGDVENGMIFELLVMGESISNVTIYNYRTMEWIGLDATFRRGDKIIFNTELGNKSVTLYRGEEAVNIINFIRKDMTWLQLPVGDSAFILDYKAYKTVDLSDHLPAESVTFESEIAGKIEECIIDLDYSLVPYSGVTITINGTANAITWTQSDIYGGTYNLISGELVSIYDAQGNILETPVTYQLDAHQLYLQEGENTVSTNLCTISSFKYIDSDEVENQATLNIKHNNQYLGI